MKLKDLGKAKGFGIEGNILNPMSWISVIAAGVMLAVGFSMSQVVTKKIEATLPVDGTPNYPFETAKVASKGYKRY